MPPSMLFIYFLFNLLLCVLFGECVMKQYRELLNKILGSGYYVEVDRTGVGTYNLNGVQMRHNLKEGFPVVTARKTAVKSAQAELEAFMNGRTNINEFKLAKPFWDRWAYPADGAPWIDAGYLGPIYGAQLRDFNRSGFDQLADLQSKLKELPYSRRHVVTYWNPLALPNEKLTHAKNIEQGNQVLPPCHVLIQCMVRPPETKGGKKVLDLLMYQRSADAPIGLPANIIYYATLQHLLALHCDYDVGEFIHDIGVAHIYTNQVEGVVEMLKTPQQETLPKLIIKQKKDNIWDYTPDDFELENYTPGPKIEIPVAV